ncbi:MinD/ParA family ATP-binding protein [Micromonospora endolithica]|uniref:ATPase n=1 Tax=Micromonospora endolithica TaxID=230091 RepID=A0A3A9ZRC7_9ACTN|nr:AAA family ATPase [Micromonospora endolithica]RKN50769.1 ATPase [Micromonospora endolithica]TWJ20475.1 MinD-like ATPase involved in chromosome partitioning or flagellar assembly [Micromonospora endolithica]
MDGSETGWGRPAEPAPRWRALLDRARLGGRSAEQAEDDRRTEQAPPDPLPRRGSGNGYAGRAPAVGHPAELSYGADPAEPTYGRRARSQGHEPPPPSYADPAPSSYGAEFGRRADAAYRAEGTYRVEPAYRADPAVEPAYRSPGDYRPAPTYPEPEPPPVESRYALLDNGYRHASPNPAESRHLLDGGYRAEQAYAPPARPAPVPPVAPPVAPPALPERGYRARVEWRPPAVDPELERATGVLRRDLGTPRVLAFANPKGGVHKTTATVLAAATVGSVRGRGVLAWDDNELRGTLGLRAGSARHARTIRHLISDLAHIEIKEGAELLEHLDDYLRHASDGSYDVLAGEESPRFAQRLDQFTVRRVLELLRRTHDVVCVDTGNNVESANWRTVMQAADQLVVTTVPREDAAFSADWMLDLLHEVGMGELADNAVTLISCPTPGRSSLQDDLERHFATRTRAVAVVPYDPALETGSSIEYPQLQAETRQAWLKAAAVMLEPFAR